MSKIDTSTIDPFWAERYGYVPSTSEIWKHNGYVPPRSVHIDTEKIKPSFPPKDDCFALFTPKNGNESKCDILKFTYCKYMRKCNFYKDKKSI